MKQLSSFRLVSFFAVLTLVLTMIIVYAWEELLMSPLYNYVETLYPGPENADHRWKVSQRIEHFFISVVVDAIVVTLLLRLVDNRQRRLRESEERYRAVFEHAGDGIGVVTADGHTLVDINKRFSDILGFPQSALIGKHVCELLREGGGGGPNKHSSILTCSVPAAAEPSDLSWSGESEIKIQSASGAALPILASCSTLSTQEGKLFILIIRDLTEQKLLEREKAEIQRQLFQSAKLASIGELSAGVAHEINNPLNGIVNFAQLLKDDGVARNDSERQMIDGIIEEGDRIAKIVRSLLTFARQDPHLPTRVQIAEVINNSMSLFGHQLSKEGIDVEIVVPEEIHPVKADASRLRQVIVNMIGNAHQALKAKADGEKLFRITAANVKAKGGDRVRVEFFDNGVGISRENLEKVFDPFFTTRRDSGGTGLGLSLSFGIVRDYGGNISVQSEEGSYTRFTVELPAATSAETEYAESAGSRRRAEHSMDDV